MTKVVEKYLPWLTSIIYHFNETFYHIYHLSRISICVPGTRDRRDKKRTHPERFMCDLRSGTTDPRSQNSKSSKIYLNVPLEGDFRRFLFFSDDFNFLLEGLDFSRLKCIIKRKNSKISEIFLRFGYFVYDGLVIFLKRL